MHIPGFEIQRTIGKGGMATVYLATPENDDLQVAVKTLGSSHPALLDDEITVAHGELTEAERFVNEGRIIASLEHEHIVEIYDVGTAESLMYIAMEYVAGGDLQGRLGTPLAVSAALEILVRIGAALGAAHDEGIVHRDVKPANILFREDGTPLLSDFGIAKDLNADSALTQTGTVLGSPFYMSPEQGEGTPVDGRADLYGLGVILYEMLTGERPYQGTSAIKVIVQHIQAPVPRLPDRVALLQPLLERLMAKDREQRFETAQAMVEIARELAAEVDAGADTSTRTQVSLGVMRQVPLADRHLLEEVVDGFRSGILEDLANDRLILPSLPDVALKVREELDRPASSGESIAKALAMDPALSAQVLRVANSAFYFGQAPVGDLQRAVVRLGSNVVQQVVMMLVVAQLYDTDSRPALRRQLERLWLHSIHVAALSEVIAKRTRGVDRNAALLAGLIHDIGTLPILVWAEPIPSVMGDDRTLSDIVAALHCDLGRQILERWRYPAELVAVPSEHEDPERNPNGKADLTDVVQVANHLAYVGTSDPKAGVDWAALPAAARLGLTGDDTEALLEAAEAARGELAAALGKS